MRARTTTVILNPAAGRLPTRPAFQKADEWLREQGWNVIWHETQRRGDASALARSAAEAGAPVVFACGGDGTVSEVAGGLQGTDTALAVIPAGTINIWAHEMGIPDSPVGAVKVGLAGARHRVDLGLAGDTPFLLMAGLGLDAQIARAVSPEAKRRFGGWSYLLAAAPQVLSYRSRAITVRFDGESLHARALMILAGNTRNYGGFVEVTPNALADDGLLDVCVFIGDGPADILAHLVRVLMRRHLEAQHVIYRQVHSLELDTPLPMQVDGDSAREACTRITVLPGVLQAMVPLGLVHPVLSRLPL